MRVEPGTYTRLHTLVFDSLVDGLRGSITVTPSTLKLYRYAPASTGPTVTVHTPFSPFVICPAGGAPGAAAPRPPPASAGISPPATRTACACGAMSRNTTRRSGITSGEMIAGPGVPRPPAAPRPGGAGSLAA